MNYFYFIGIFNLWRSISAIVLFAMAVGMILVQVIAMKGGYQLETG